MSIRGAGGLKVKFKKFGTTFFPDQQMGQKSANFSVLQMYKSQQSFAKLDFAPDFSCFFCQCCYPPVCIYPRPNQLPAAPTPRPHSGTMGRMLWKGVTVSSWCFCKVWVKASRKINNLSRDELAHPSGYFASFFSGVESSQCPTRCEEIFLIMRTQTHSVSEFVRALTSHFVDFSEGNFQKFCSPQRVTKWCTNGCGCTMASGQKELDW